MTEHLNSLEANQPVIAVRELRKVFHGAGGMFKSSAVVAVDGVSVHVGRGETVAVVGAGPAGMACAHRLALHGHTVTVFEARKKGGGLNEFLPTCLGQQR